ncbi:hypothetical protein BD309DRAFT_1024528, partial [Dichomitus squalens]
LSTVIGVLCDGFCTAPLRTLSFEKFYDAAPVAAWRLPQAAFPDLQTIRVQSEDLGVIRHFFLALREVALKGGWPSLSRLEVDFGYEYEHNSLGWHVVLQPLVEAARTWLEQGLGLDDIILQRMHITRWHFGPHRWALLSIAALCDRFTLRDSFVDDDFFYDALEPVSELLTTAQYHVSTGQQAENTADEDPKQAATDGTEGGSLEVELPEIEGVVGNLSTLSEDSLTERDAGFDTPLSNFAAIIMTSLFFWGITQERTASSDTTQHRERKVRESGAS